MIHGFNRFKQQFAPFTNNYVLIGGTACSLVLEEAGLGFRTTKDLDIVLCIEALDRRFGEAFWEFIRLGRYKNRQKSTGRKLFYRFNDPEDPAYPVMIELFSRKPDAMPLSDNCHLTAQNILDKSMHDIESQNVGRTAPPTIHMSGFHRRLPNLGSHKQF